MPKMSLPLKPKQRKIICLLCLPNAPALDSNYRNKYNNKEREKSFNGNGKNKRKKEMAKGKSIPYKNND